MHVDDCEQIGLKIKRLEDDRELRDLVLTVHHCYMHTLANTPAYKLVENHLGRRMVKMTQQQIMLLQQPPSGSIEPKASA